jgi:predicted nucleic acid-binding protein
VIVLDASAMVVALVGRRPDEQLWNAARGDVDTSHLLDVEVLSVRPALLRGGKPDTRTAEQARLDHFAFTSPGIETAPLADRVWQLRHECTQL